MKNEGDHSRTQRREETRKFCCCAEDNVILNRIGGSDFYGHTVKHNN